MSSNNEELLISMIKNERANISSAALQMNSKLEVLNGIISTYDQARSKKPIKEAYATILPSQFFLGCAVAQNADTTYWYEYPNMVLELQPLALSLDRLSFAELATIKGLLDFYVDYKALCPSIKANKKLLAIYDGIVQMGRDYNIEQAIQLFAISINYYLFCRRDMQALLNKVSPQSSSNTSDLLQIYNDDFILSANSPKELENVIRMYKQALLIANKNKTAFNKNRAAVVGMLDDILNQIGDLKEGKTAQIIINKEFAKYLSSKLRFSLEYLNTELRAIDLKRVIKINQRLEKFDEKSVTTVLRGFKINALSLTDEAQKCLIKCDLEYLEKALNIFLTNGFSLIELLNNGLAVVIGHSSLEQINDIMEMISLKILDFGMVRNNLGVFINESDSDLVKPLYDKIITNIGVLKKYNPDFQTEYYYHSSLLLTDTSILEANIALYSIYKRYIGTINCQLLAYKGAFALIDYFIEKGYNLNILNSIDLSQIQISMVMMRLELASSCEPVVNDNVIISCFSDKYYVSQLISAGDTKKYIINDVDKEIDHDLEKVLQNSDCSVISDNVGKLYPIKLLDQEYLDVDGRSYDFDGISISRLKVLRQLEVLLPYHNFENSLHKLLYTAIIYNSTLNSEELSRIKACLSEFDFSSCQPSKRIK